MSESFLQRVEDDVLSMDPFPAKPGGLVDQARKRKAAEAAKAEQDANAEQEIEERAYKAVKVALETPEVFNATSFNIAAGSYAMVLPADDFRDRAVVNLVTATATAVLAKDASNAAGQNGYTISTLVPLEIRSRGQVWAYNPGADLIQVAVMSETYAPDSSAR